jgi:murein DD-endopeptidase MepM/ murein hydrolase activator NlpD
MSRSKLFFFIALFSIILLNVAQSLAVDEKNDFTISWEKPKINTNGKELIDLKGYFIYLSETEIKEMPKGMTIESCNSDIHCRYVGASKDSNIESTTIQGLEAKQYYIIISAIDEVPNYVGEGNSAPVVSIEKALERVDTTSLSSGDITWPVMSGPMEIGSCYGWRTLSKGKDWHDGIDISLPVGTPVLSVSDGTVIETCHATKNQITDKVRECSGFGGYVYIKHDALGTYSQYSHLSKVNVARGQKVSAGEVIGLSGNTGYSEGPHLDFKYYTSAKRTEVVGDYSRNPFCFLPKTDVDLNGASCKDSDGDGSRFCP